MANRLIREVSPYLLQHAHNPVDWYPWGEEALTRARAEDKPILLSIGYSACHWCHVMEHESFEDAATAALMNEHFVNIKVDREERPDLDAIYMTAVQGLTGHGGWPMTVFLTPEGKPFYGGTYFPPDDRGGMPAFRHVLTAISEAYHSRRDEVNNQANVVVTFIQQQVETGAPSETLDSTVLDAAFVALSRQFNPTYGGFGGAPKFPQAMALEFLLRYHHRTGNPQALEMVEATLGRMAAGGIYDQVGGGFHRYSVDERWQVPHFEKMLYDNALLARTYLHAYQVSGHDRYREVAEETLDYVLRDMRDSAGGFYSAQDADSEGHEGAYYLWTPEGVREAVGGEDAPLVCLYFGVTPTGSVEGKSTLTRPLEVGSFAASAGLGAEQAAQAIGRARRALSEARTRRVPPATDDKIVCAWNGLMLRSFAEAFRALGHERYRAAAEANAAFLLGELWRDGHLLRVHRAQKAAIGGYLEDYAALADGLLALYEATFDLQWFLAARDLAAALVQTFWDQGGRELRDTGHQAERLVARPKERWDNATPSGTSLACQALLRLWALTGDSELEAIARAELARMVALMAEHPVGMGNALCALDFYLGPPDELAIIGHLGDPPGKQLLDAVRPQYLPRLVLAGAAPADTEAQQAIPLLRHRPLVEGRPTAYLCHGHVCNRPTTEVDELVDQLRVRG